MTKEKFGLINENGVWRVRIHIELKLLFKEPNLGMIMWLRRLQWTGHVQRIQDQRIWKKTNATIEKRRSYGRLGTDDKKKSGRMRSNY